MTTTVTAAELLGFRLCTGQCLLGLEHQCVCRCRGRWHAILSGAEVPIPDGLTLASALAGGPAGSAPGRRAWASETPGPRVRATASDTELHFAADLAAGQVPSVRRVKREMNVGTNRARELRAHLESITSRT